MFKKVFFLLVLAVTLVLVLVVVRFASPEDTWLCQGDLWVKHGNSSVPMPTKPCTYGNSDSGLVQGNSVGMANPASVNCTDKGGTLAIEKRSDGGEYGVCYFEDNYQCEEWALMRGECPVGGRKVTGYVTEAGRYCAITGGEYFVIDEGNPTNEKGTCALVGGQVCEAEAYYAGTCPANQ